MFYNWILQIILSLGLFAIGSAKPAAPTASASEPIPIIKYDNEGVNADGSYQWR